MLRLRARRARMHVRMRECTHAHTHTRTHTHTHTHTHTQGNFAALSQQRSGETCSLVGQDRCLNCVRVCMCVCACACAHASTYSFIPIAREAQVSHTQDLAQPDKYMYACMRTRACIHTQRRCSTHVPWRNRRWRAAVCDRGDRKQVLVGGGRRGG